MDRVAVYGWCRRPRMESPLLGYSGDEIYGGSDGGFFRPWMVGSTSRMQHKHDSSVTLAALVQLFSQCSASLQLLSSSHSHNVQRHFSCFRQAIPTMFSVTSAASVKPFAIFLSPFMQSY